MLRAVSAISPSQALCLDWMLWLICIVQHARSRWSGATQKACERGGLRMHGAMCRKMASSFFHEASKAAYEGMIQAEFSKILRLRPELVLSFHEKQLEPTDKQVQHCSVMGLSMSYRSPPQSCLFRIQKARTRQLHIWLARTDCSEISLQIEIVLP